MPLTSVSADVKTSALLANVNVAVSADPLGMVAGIQLAEVFQSALTGLTFQVALPAWVD